MCHTSSYRCTPDGCKPLIDCAGGEPEGLQVKPESQNHGSIQGEPWLGTVPCNEWSIANL